MHAPPNGAVIQIRKGPSVLLARVMARKGERLLSVLGDDGATYKVPPQRILQVGGLVEADERSAVRAALGELRERSLAAAAEVDLELLWSQVHDDKSGADIAALCRVYMGTSGTVEERLGFGFCLCADRLWFKQQGERFVPRMESEILKRKQQMDEERLAAERRQIFVAWAASALANDGDAAARRPGDVGDALALLERLAVRGEETGQAAKRARALIGDVAAALPQGVDRLAPTPEGAFRLLVALGEFAEHENLPLRRLATPQSFPAELEQAAEAAPPYVYDAGREPDREDLRHLEALTIDAADTTDRDDALSLEDLGEGRWRLGVHIADAAAWVAPDSPLDQEALRRATSIYLPDGTIPMFPPAMAERRMSLESSGDRPALSFLAELDAEGNVLGHRAARSVVRVRQNLSYADADAILARGDEPLVSMQRLLGAVRARRIAGGAVVVPGRDRRVRVQPGGAVEVTVVQERTASSTLVAEAMILANGLAAGELHRRGAPAIYRSQRMGGDKPVLREDHPSEEVYAYHLRRRLARTELGTKPGRHATLGLDAYAQVTSPIRRYQDLVLQRQLAEVLAGRPPAYDGSQIVEVLGATEAATGDANQVSRETETYWLLESLRRQIGSRWQAVVLGPVRDRRTLLEIPALDLRTVIRARKPLAPGTRVELELDAASPRRGTQSFRLIEVLGPVAAPSSCTTPEIR
jgi:exoribonuclease-2